MAYGEKLQVEGLGALNKQLDAIGGKEARRAMAAAHRVTAMMVYRDAHIHVPIGSQRGAKGPKSEHPGRLWRTLRVQATNRRGSVLVGGGRAPYGAAIHWGYPKRGIIRRPFIWQALGRNQARIRLEFFKEMDKVLSHYGLNRDNV